MFALCLLVVLAAEPLTVKDFDAAKKEADAADAVYREGLGKLLSSENAYAKAQALERLATSPTLLTPELVARIAPLLRDSTSVYRDPGCIGAEQRYAKSMAQGVILEAAECVRYNARELDELAAAALLATANLPVSDAVAPAVLDVALAGDRSVDGHVTAILKATRSLDLAPLLERLGWATTPERRSRLLDWALFADHSSVPAAPALTPLLTDPDRRTQGRAAAILLRAGQLDDALTKRATEVLRAVLLDRRDASAGDGVARDLRALDTASVQFVPVLTERLKQKIGEPAASWEGLSGAAQELDLRTVMRQAGCGDRCFEAMPVEVIAAFGAKASGSKPALLAGLQRDPGTLIRVAEALDATQARVDAAEWKRLYQPYAKECAEAGSIPFFSLRRDDDCARTAKTLAKIAERSGVTFREVGWQG